MAHLATGIFPDRLAAEQAVTDLQKMGYDPKDISVMMSNQTHAREFANSTGTKAAAGTGWGAGIGGVLGFIVAAATATGSIAATVATGGAALPFVAGPLAAAWAGAGIGGLSGGIIGWLVGLGIPEERAKLYEAGLNAGGILVGVYAETGDLNKVQRVLMNDGATNIQTDQSLAAVR